MRPADLIVLIRQRSEWEAIDLGFSLIQYAWRSLFPVWLLLLSTFLLLCFLLTPRDYIWAAGIALWWIKPLFDRVLLHILSRQLFGQQLSIAEAFSALPGLVRNTGLLSALTWRRFSFSRTYNLPIWQLERLRGEPRKQRHALLYLQGHSAAIALTIVCVMLELIVALSIYALIVIVDPSGHAWEHLKAMFSDTSGSEMEYLLSVADLMIHAIAILIIEPFFVAAGFSLYLNRRTRLEAWDIEIAFRSLGERLTALTANMAGTALLLCTALLLSFSTLSPNAVMAADNEFLHPERLPVSESSVQLEQVMQREELNDRRQVNIWVPRNKETSDQDQMSEELIQLIAAIFKYFLWAVVAILLVLSFVYRHTILAMLRPPRKTETPYEQPDVLFGMDIRPESLPDDIAGAAREHWQQGHHRESLSLLYRGALMQLTRRDILRIADSATEGDVLTQAKPLLADNHYTYLQQLTRHWQTIAYAHRVPDNTDIDSLFDQWPLFQQTANNEPTVSADQQTAVDQQRKIVAGQPKNTVADQRGDNA